MAETLVPRIADSAHWQHFGERMSAIRCDLISKRVSGPGSVFANRAAAVAPAERASRAKHLSSEDGPRPVEKQEPANNDFACHKNSSRNAFVANVTGANR